MSCPLFCRQLCFHSYRRHHMLKDMMERPRGGLDWSLMHNSPFELSKLTCMDFIQPNTNPTASPLTLTIHPTIDAPSIIKITTTQTYKYLGVIFDPKLSWSSHINRLMVNAT